MTTALLDHYETLRVSRDASAAELRKAYFALIKEHTPENDPEQFRIISEAYRTLANPETRKAYDAEERIPPHVAARLHDINEMAEDDPDEALDWARDLAMQNPGIEAVQFRLGALLDQQEQYEEAAAVFQSLLDANPESSNFALWLGDALVHTASAERGEDYLKQAIVLDRGNKSAYNALAQHYARADRDAEALAILQRGIDADDQVDLQDLSLLIARVFILARVGPWESFEREIRNVTSVAPRDDEDARQYVASQLWPLVEFFGEVKRPDLTQAVVEAVLVLTPNPELQGMADRSRSWATMFRQRWQLLDDDSVPKWIKALVYGYTDDDITDGQRQNLYVNVALEIAGDSNLAKRQWDRAKSRYPDLLSEMGSLWQNICSAARSNASSNASSSSSEAPGCSLAVLLMLAAFLLANWLT